METMQIMHIPKGRCPLDEMEVLIGDKPSSRKADFWLSKRCRDYLRQKTGAKVLSRGLLYWPPGNGDKFAILFMIKGRVIFGKFRFGHVGNIFSKQKVRIYQTGNNGDLT